MAGINASSFRQPQNVIPAAPFRRQAVKQRDEADRTEDFAFQTITTTGHLQ
jgi:hypothetical protein